MSHFSLEKLRGNSLKTGAILEILLIWLQL